jgi:glucose-6-phosphate isomerase
MATELIFRLNLSREQALCYYQGAARAVIVTTTTGQKLQFPAERIRAFVGPDGIQGTFSIRFDQNNRLIDLKRV